MFWILAFAALTLFAAVLLVLAPCRIEFHYERVRSNDRIDLNVRALWFLHYKWSIPHLNLVSPKSLHLKTKREASVGTSPKGDAEQPADTDHKEVSPRTVRRVLRTYLRWRRLLAPFESIMRRLRRSLQCESFRWETVLGVADAGQTGMFAGLGWSLKWTLIGWLSSQIPFRCLPVVNVLPRFNRPSLETRLDCILRLRIGQAIFAALQLAFVWMREGRSWRNTRFKV